MPKKLQNNYPVVLSISAYPNLNVTAIISWVQIVDGLLRIMMRIIFGTLFLNSVVYDLCVIRTYAGEAKSTTFENISLDESAWNMVKYL
jgi:hypothetical protein